MHTVRDGSDVGAPKHRGGYLSVQIGDGIDRRRQCYGKVRHGAAATFLGVACVADEVLGILGQQITDDLSNQRPRKSVVARRHRRVRGEQGPLCEFFSAPTLAQHFQHGKRAVPFVEVHARKVMPQGLKGLNTANAEQVFLSDAHLIVATVQDVRPVR